MPREHLLKTGELDSKSVIVKLSPAVRSAFGDLAAAVHFSEHFDAGTFTTVEQLATGKSLSVDDLIGSFPMIAKETFNHIHNTGDQRAERAWQEIGSTLLEEGFALFQGRSRLR